MGLDWTIGGFIMLGIIANSWRRVLGYVADAVDFDGTNDYLLTTTGSGATDNNTALYSCWFYGNTPDATVFFVKGDNNPNTQNFQSLQFFYDVNGFAVRLWNGQNAQSIVYTIWSTELLEANQWNHILLTIDNGTLRFYINDVAAGFSTGLSTINILHSGPTYAWTGPFTNLGAQSMEAAEMYYTNETMDITIEANRRKFITSTGTPADLGIIGQLPTGTSPLIYFKGDAASWNAGTNTGTVSGFAMTGAVTDSLNEPVELP